jgi:hypothetical protein
MWCLLRTCQSLPLNHALSSPTGGARTDDHIAGHQCSQQSACPAGETCATTAGARPRGAHCFWPRLLRHVQCCKTGSIAAAMSHRRNSGDTGGQESMAHPRGARDYLVAVAAVAVKHAQGARPVAKNSLTTHVSWFCFVSTPSRPAAGRLTS